MQKFKHFILLGGIILISFGVNAQIVEKGQFTAGLNFLSQLDIEGKADNQQIPSFSYAVSNDITIGTEVLASVSTDGSSIFMFHPNARYYFSNFYGQLGLFYSRFSNGDSDSNIDISIAGGYAFTLTDRILIEPNIRLIPGDVTFFGMGLGVQFILNN